MSMDYDAVAISASDIDSGKKFLEETLENNFPWVSANLIDENGQLVAQPYILKTVNSLRIAIIGLTEPSQTPGQYVAVDPTASLTTLVKELTGQSDIIILLSNLPGETNQNIASQFSDIDIIISSDKSLGKMAPKEVNNTLITQSSSRGKYLGKLEIEWNYGETWYNNRRLPLAELRKRKTTIETQLTQLINNTKSSNKKRISRLQLQQQRLTQEIESREIQESESGDLPANRHKLRFIPVQPTHSPNSIESIVVNIDKAIKEQSAPK